MKYLRLFGIVWLVALLALFPSVEVMACEALKTARDEAHTAPPPPPSEDSGSDSDDDADDSDDTEGPKCGAHGWTGCGGSAGDHDATCAAGHSYYTCNTTAAERHAKH